MVYAPFDGTGSAHTAPTSPLAGTPGSQPRRARLSEAPTIQGEMQQARYNRRAATRSVWSKPHVMARAALRPPIPPLAGTPGSQPRRARLSEAPTIQGGAQQGKVQQ